MMRVFKYILLFVFLLVFLGTCRFLYKKSQKPPVEAKTEKPAVMDIVKKTVATGAITPRQEVEIKPRVSGVLEELYVEPGAMVKTGDKIAKIQIVADAVTLNRAQSEVQAARIAFDNARRELEREKKLLAQGVVADAEVARFETDFALRRQTLDSASANLQLVKEGQARGAAGSKNSNIMVVSTVTGMVIDVPVKVGFSVIESNNFNPGTTIAVVADMGDMIFAGQVDESEVGKIKQGMKLKIKVGALGEEQTIDGTLEYIAPKGKEIDGAIQFEIKAKVVPPKDVFIRAGYSANADIVLEEKKQVLAMREALLQFEDEKPFVEVETSPKHFEKKPVEVGLSDGINVEIKSGVTADAAIKIPENAGPAEMGAPGNPAARAMRGRAPGGGGRRR